jgi:hypothetical protein
VTNAVLHGGGCVVLGLHAHEGNVTMSVADGSAVVPRRYDDAGLPDREGAAGHRHHRRPRRTVGRAGP